MRTQALNSQYHSRAIFAMFSSNIDFYLLAHEFNMINKVFRGIRHA
jgi:hypothetical protein